MATEEQIGALQQGLDALIVALEAESAIPQAVADGATTIAALARALRKRGDALLALQPADTAQGTRRPHDFEHRLIIGREFHALASELEQQIRTT